MDGPKKSHTEWNKSGREEKYHMTYDMWDLKRNDTDELTLKNRNRLTDIETSG